MSFLLRNVALVPDDNIGNQLSSGDASKVAAALQKQVTRDFSPIWGVTATVDAFAGLDDVPLGYWPILVGNEGQGGGGVHLDEDNQPYALVDFTPDWTITASHECLEMLADPFGSAGARRMARGSRSCSSVRSRSSRVWAGSTRASAVCAPGSIRTLWLAARR